MQQRVEPLESIVSDALRTDDTAGYNRRLCPICASLGAAEPRFINLLSQALNGAKRCRQLKWQR